MQPGSTSADDSLLHAQAATAGGMSGGAALAALSLAGPAVCRQPTLIVCQECVRAGRKHPYSKPFYGRRINLETGEEEPMDYLHLPVSELMYVCVYVMCM